MISFRVPLGIRARLTLWYVAAMVVVLTVYALGVFGFVSRSISRTLDSRIRGDFMWASEMWEQQPDGSLTWFDAEDIAQDEDNPWLQVWSLSGQLLFQTAVAKRNPLPETAALAADPSGHIVTIRSAGVTFRVLSRLAIVGGKSVVVQVARSEAPMRRELQELSLFLLLGLPIGVAAAGLGGYAVARGALAPVNRMAERARSITAARLNDRLPIHNPHDELGRLALVFNQTLERLEESFQQMQRFTADVSHELRTPLTAIRTVGEVALRDTRSPDAYREIVGSMLEEVDRLTCLVDRLLTLSRAGSQPAHLSIEPVNLRDLADEVTAHLSVLAEEKRQSIVVRHLGAARCEGDRLMLRQAVINLVDNAIKYSPVESEIQVRVCASATHATLEVSDNGPGIDPERSARIFDRFYRGGYAGDCVGIGLGLSIAKWAVEVNRGELTWEARAGGGSTFRIALPGTDACDGATEPDRHEYQDDSRSPVSAMVVSG
jgi:heavy metal sensor kinase